MKASIKFFGFLTLVIILFLTAFSLIKPSQYWEIAFRRITPNEIELKVFLQKDLVETLTFYDSEYQFVPEIVKFDAQDKVLPVGELVFLDVTWPPGRLKIKIGNELIEIKQKRYNPKVINDVQSD